MPIIGIDVSKNKLHCALLSEAGKLKSKVFSNSPEGHIVLLQWAERLGQCQAVQLHAVLEATGVYHEAIAVALHRAGARVSVVNPAQVKHFAQGLAVKSKTDASDPVVLARYGALVKPPPWEPPPPEITELKALITRLEAIEGTMRRELNRIEKTTITGVPTAVRGSLEKSVSFLKEEKARLEKTIREHIDQHPTLKQDRHLLESIPAVGPKTAWRMLTLLRARTFTRAPQAAAYVGLVPIEHQSGTSVLKRPRLSKAGDARLRAALYMAAVVATQYNPDIRRLYQRLIARGKTKMSALGAAMRKLVHICFGVLKHQRPYQPQSV